MKSRTWKTFYISGTNNIGWLRSCLQSFPHPEHTARIESYPGGGILETDLSISSLRKLFRFAGVAWQQYITDTKPTWEQSEEN